MTKGSWFSLGDYGRDDNSGNRFGLMDITLTQPRPSFEAFKGASAVAADRDCGPRASTTIAGDVGANVSKKLVNGQKVSGVLSYKFEAPPGLQVQTITLKINGKVIRTIANPGRSSRCPTARASRSPPS